VAEEFDEGAAGFLKYQTAYHPNGVKKVEEVA